MNAIPHWMSENTQVEISKKRKIRSNQGHRSIEYKTQKSNVKKLCKIDKQNLIDREHKELNDLPPDTKYYTLMKRMKLSRTTKVKSWGIKSTTNTVLSSSADILDRWAEFYENLYSSNTAGIASFPEIDPIPCVTLSELQHAIKQLNPIKHLIPTHLRPKCSNTAVPNYTTNSYSS